MGSLVTALGSYLQARQARGLWRLRIDDIDPPRVASNASEQIQYALLCHGLQWDGEVYYQSHHLGDYQQALAHLQEQQRVYRCDCTRKQIKTLGQYYQQTCKHKQTVGEPFAWRLDNQGSLEQFYDKRLGWVSIDSQAASEDFILKRRDGLFAYHLASVVDDINMQVSEVVRGEDLLNPTACQVALYQLLAYPVPDFVHLPLVCSSDGKKLSKQNHAAPLNLQTPQANLCQALRYLHIDLPKALYGGKISELLDWAVTNWTLKSSNIRPN